MSKRRPRIMWRDEYDGKLHEIGPNGKERVVIEERLFDSWDQAMAAFERPRFDTFTAAELQTMTEEELDMTAREYRASRKGSGTPS